VNVREATCYSDDVVLQELARLCYCRTPARQQQNTHKRIHINSTLLIIMSYC